MHSWQLKLFYFLQPTEELTSAETEVPPGRATAKKRTGKKAHRKKSAYVYKRMRKKRTRKEAH